MYAAIAARPGVTAVIGTDCPFLESTDLVRAADVLHASSADVVSAPAFDGGYVMIAVDRPRPELFDGIAWGTGRVLAQSRERAHAAGLRLVELQARPDVDRPRDLHALAGVLRW